LRTNSTIRLLVCLAAFATSLRPALAKDDLILQRTFDSSVERVYAAEVRSANSTLQNSVKEACLVNFRTAREQYVQRWTATCAKAGDGKVTVVVSVQGDWFIGVGGYRKKTLDVFWHNMDLYVRLSSEATDQAKETSKPQLASPADTASMLVTSDPTNADITIDGEYNGSTPSQLKLKPGQHTVSVSKRGFQTWERSVKVESGESRTINANLEKVGP
jgi:hypothetical protein